MRSEESIKNLYEQFKKANPREWILQSNDPRLQGWYDGYKEAMEDVLQEDTNE